MGALLIGGLALGAGGAYLSSKGASDSAQAASDAAIANSANQNQYSADVQQQYMDQLDKLLGNAGSDVWGSVPQWAPYQPVDPTYSQSAAIMGNFDNLPNSIDLSNRVNSSIWQNDLNRVRVLTPGYDQSVANLSAEIGARLQGQTTLGDTWSNLISDRAEVSAALGTPGTQQPALAKDLGLKQHDLFNSGASMFTQWLDTANQSISPISNQMRPQQMMFSPQERLSADLQQAQLVQQSNQSGFNLAAMPDPSAAGPFYAQMNALGTSASAAAGPAPTVVSGASPSGASMSALGQGLSGMGGVLMSSGANTLGKQATQPTGPSGGIQYQQSYNPYGYQPSYQYAPGGSTGYSMSPYG